MHSHRNYDDLNPEFRETGINERCLESVRLNCVQEAELRKEEE